ncbi:type III secretion system chaperone [Variovorax paradoxus]|nr:type III secretion system chaperone [Variovorax paradoxus]
MHTFEATRQLIMDMAPNATDIEEIQESDDGTWGFGFSDESVMTAEWADLPPRLVLIFFLGAPPDEHRLAACELLLGLNLLSAETGGVRGGMAPNGNFTLIYDLHAGPLTEVDFREIVMNFAALGRKWGRTIRAELNGLTLGFSAGRQLM